MPVKRKIIDGKRYRQCNECPEWFSEAQYPKRSKCPVCQKKYRAVYYKENRDKHNRKTPYKNIKPRGGATTGKIAGLFTGVSEKAQHAMEQVEKGNYGPFNKLRLEDMRG